MIARKDTWSYRASKFVRRNKTGVIAAALVVLALVGGIVATSWQAQVARAERAKAERRFNEVRHLAIPRSLNYTTPLKNFPVRLLRANYW